ncbi:AAA family ATPase [Rhodoblastus sp.]|jgi:energy-coupling factor transporter ATP-binding protein EcfA2|uniref:AAA family ATPase n=1 Tax=Rhodoblastus sp. TaxID=1962975 RepID=UPI0025D4BE96|nr:AAA family ATPase [Rhodoblastus sp.]
MNEATIINVEGLPSAGTAPVAVTNAPIIAPIKIKTLTVCDFRAFAGPEPVTIALSGKNLLVYGENGAGKSSIFHALNEFFSIELADAAGRQARFTNLRNRFSALPPSAGYIEIELDDGKPAARWDQARHPADITPASDARIVNGAYRKAILDYRALLDTNYRHGSGVVNLFDVCVGVLLRDYPVVIAGGTEAPLISLWQKLEGFAAKARDRTRPHLRKKEIDEVNVVAASFNQGLRDALDHLRPRIDPLLFELGWDDLSVISFGFPGVTYDNARLKTGREFEGRSITVGLTFRGTSLSSPQTFLNEARLSALALAIYFAGRQVCAATLQTDTPRLMVLDDVLIGLDQSNRLPVLQALDKHFPDWQIVLLTHDRVWFEMARFHLADRKDWNALELFEEIEPTGGSRPVLRPQNIDAVASNIATARKFHTAHEYPASAVHARVAFELSLKKVCERKAIPVRFQIDPRKLTTDDLLNAIEIWLGEPSRVAMKSAVDPAIASLRMWRKVVLNPFSHSTPVSLTAVEVIGAIDAVEALHQAFRDHFR